MDRKEQIFGNQMSCLLEKAKKQKKAQKMKSKPKPSERAEAKEKKIRQGSATRDGLSAWAARWWTCSSKRAACRGSAKNCM